MFIWYASASGYLGGGRDGDVNKKGRVMKTRTAMMAALCGAFALGDTASADQILMTGIVRDFKRGDWNGGHPDFETAGSMGRFGHVLNMVTMDLGEDGKPVYNTTRPSKDTMHSKTRFDQWYRDVIGVNLSTALTLPFDNEQSEPGGTYTYQNNAFWPVNSQLFGNQNLGKNFHFTFELHTNFTYTPNQKFTFIGDDDVWVYINGKRCIDLGGVHGATTGSVFLFDGKAWVTKSHFVTGGAVKAVTSSSELSALHTKWFNLGLPGVCPIAMGDKYIDLNLNGGFGDTRATFNGASATVYAVDPIQSVVVTFNTGHTQTFTPGGTTATVAGNGIHQNRPISHVTIFAGANTNGQMHAANGGTSINCKLDFFFAERHTTQSNFRIDTSMLLNTIPPTTISPLYD